MAPHNPEGRYPSASLEIFKAAPQFFCPGPKLFPLAVLFFRLGSDLKKLVVRKSGNNYWTENLGKGRNNMTLDDLPTDIVHENLYSYLLSKSFSICTLQWRRVKHTL